MKIDTFQKKILRETLKRSLKNFARDYEDANYLSLWSKNCGNFYLKKRFLKNELFFNLLESFNLLFRKLMVERTKYRFLNYLPNKKKKKFANLVISYQYDIKKNYDLQFATDRRKTNKTIWLIIDFNKKKQKINYNSIVIKKKHSPNRLSTFILTILLFPIWFFLKKKSIKEKNFLNILDEIIYYLSDFNFEKVFLPYEAQPYQKFLINSIKKKNVKTKVIGYGHGGLPSLPTEYFKNKNIDKFYLHSKTEKEILINNQGWKKNQLFVDKSFRHIRKNNVKKNYIYLPYNFTLNSKLYLDFKKLFMKYNLDNFKIANHPAMLHSKKHLVLKAIINYLKKKHKNQGLKVDNTSIFLGVTGSILEGLQNKINIIHLMNYPEFELYSNHLWKNIIVKKLFERIYLYKLKKGSNLIVYSKKNYFIKKFDL